MQRIAITGNIASGKSQVEKILNDLGFIVYDSDKIAHEVLNSITNFYGYNVFTNGKIDRTKLGKLVFVDCDLKKKLENLTHPKIKSKILEIFDKNKDCKFVFVSVPLLYEAHFEDIFDKVVLITVNKNIQLERLMARNNYSKQDALQRINAQIPQEEKINKANFVIENNASIEDLRKQVTNFIKLL